jgi:hypothetical protein
LIDDRWQDLLVALQELEAQAAASPRFQRMLEGARRRLTLVAFGVSSIDEPVLPSGIRVVALPSWEAFDAQSLAESVAHAQGAGNYG